MLFAITLTMVQGLVPTFSFLIDVTKTKTVDRIFPMPITATSNTKGVHKYELPFMEMLINVTLKYSNTKCS